MGSGQPLPTDGDGGDEMAAWEAAWLLLSLERCQRFYREMGLPERLIVNPEPMRQHARSYLSEDGVRYGSRCRGADWRMCLEDSLRRIGLDYGRVTAEQFVDWCTRYIVDRDNATALWSWGHLFRRLCRLITEDDTIITPLDVGVTDRVCGVVGRHLRPGQARDIHRQIEEAKQLPLSSWDDQLEAGARLCRGDGASAIEATLELTEYIITCHRLFLLWGELAGQITPEERESLMNWARGMAATTGIPANVIARTPV